MTRLLPRAANTAVVLQQAVEQLLRERGWDVVSEGHLIVAEKEDAAILLGFVVAEEAGAFAERAAEETVSVAAVLLDKVPSDVIVRMQEAGIVCFEREAVEDAVLAGLFQRPAGRSDFERFLEGD